LFDYLAKKAIEFGLVLEEINFKHSCFDHRNNWDTYYVLTKFENEDNFVVSGMSNGTF